jgi:hypothetical protein
MALPAIRLVSFLHLIFAEFRPKIPKKFQEGSHDLRGWTPPAASFEKGRVREEDGPNATGSRYSRAGCATHARRARPWGGPESPLMDAKLLSYAK